MREARGADVIHPALYCTKTAMVTMLDRLLSNLPHILLYLSLVTFDSFENIFQYFIQYYLELECCSNQTNI